MSGITRSVDISFSKLLDSIPPKVRRALTLRFDRSPFDTVDSLVEFTQTRAAYVAQTSLYGYLKTRMGTRYRYVFEDPVMAKSISIAKWQVYAACLSDLSVFAAATARQGHGMRDAETTELARFCFESAIQQTFDEVDDPDIRESALAGFGVRLGSTDWDNAAVGENAFRFSPAELIRWAPIADELKELDSDIVTNSIRFRWRDVREQLRKRIDGDAICNEWHAARS
jgi:hypothetical protein